MKERFLKVVKMLFTPDKIHWFGMPMALPVGRLREAKNSNHKK